MSSDWQPPERAAPAAAQTRYAGWGYRVGAFLTDAGLALLVGALAGLAIGRDEDTQSTILVFVAIGTWLLITSVAMGVFKGQTVGKRIAGIRVVKHGRPVGFGLSLLRDQVCRLLYLIPLFFLVDSIWAAADGERQTLRDKMVDTHVVHAGANAARAVAVAVTAVVFLAGWVGTTTALEDDEPSTAAGVEVDAPGYSDLDRQVFVDGCTDEGSPEADCVCLFEYVAPRVPYDVYVDVESEDPDTWPAELRDTMADAIAECT